MCFTGLFLFGAPTVRAQNAREEDPALTRLLRWFEDVRLHAPGSGDAAATEVGRWSRGDLEVLVADIRTLSTFLERARDGRESRAVTTELYDRRFTVAEVEKIFRGNDTLRRGAVLHADVAMFVDDDFSRRRTDVNQPGNFIVEDGRRRGGVRYQTVHWRIGRLVLDAILPRPSGDAGALLWYRATSAHLLREGHLAEVTAHLERARQVFPDNRHVLLDSAYLHQKFSAPEIQAAVQDLRAEGANVAVDSRRAELDRAERFFRQTLAHGRGADQSEVRIRLGHTLGELGRHEEAAAELRGALDADPRGQWLYFAELFLGREEEVLGRRDAARRHYENAAELYPRAQSPRLSLSELARQSGDRAGALLALRGVTSLPLADFERMDPWWHYYEAHMEDAATLMEQMRGLVRVESQ